MNPRSVDAQRAQRERFAQWYQRKTGGTAQRHPWLRGAPVYGPFLPGGGCVLRIDPHPKWSIELRNTRALHGMMTSLTGPHNSIPPFTLVPWQCRSGWGVYLADDVRARGLAGRTHAAVLFDRPVAVSFSLLMRLRSPRRPKRGRQRVRLDTVTPVSICSDNRAVTYLRPTAESIRGSLGGTFLGRLGLDGLLVPADDVCVELVSSDAHQSSVPVGGKWGDIRGWSGSCVLEVNAVARWLLECAATIGIGGRCAIGMGRIKVSDAD